MRLVIKQDFKITDDESDELLRRITDLYYENANITPEFYVEKTDYSNYPTYVDSDGDIRPTSTYLKSISDGVYSRYGEFGTDHIIVLIHEDNWKSDTDQTRGIWGTSYSNLWGHSYHLQYVRYDRDNMANSQGTFYHELMHSHDNLIKVTLGVDISPLIKVAWDKFCVHGGRPDKEGTTPYKYIRYKENLDALQYIAPYLKKAYEKRKELYDDHVGKMKTIIALLQKIVVLLRAKMNKKDGIPR